MISIKVKDIGGLRKKMGGRNLFIACGLCPYWNYSAEDIAGFAQELGAEVLKLPPICDNPRIEVGDLAGFDSVFVFACGAGIQIVSEQLGREVIPAADTIGIGVKHRDKVEVYCRACGNCILDSTAGICPIARCPKGLLNGPCGGVQDGRCELGDRECVWVQIYERMKASGRLDEFVKTRLPEMR